MRGDRPRYKRIEMEAYKFTPHARGSTHMEQYLAAAGYVYPACAGIDLSWSISFI